MDLFFLWIDKRRRRRWESLEYLYWRGRRTPVCQLRSVFQSWTPLRFDLIFTKAIKTDDPHPPCEDTQERWTSHHIDSRDKKTPANANKVGFLIASRYQTKQPLKDRIDLHEGTSIDESTSQPNEHHASQTTCDRTLYIPLCIRGRTKMHRWKYVDLLSAKPKNNKAN